MSADELRVRIQELILEGDWSGPEFGSGLLAAQLQAQAMADAIEALDAVPPEAEPEIGLTPSRETLLHWTAKQLLGELGAVVVPDVKVPWQAWMRLAGVNYEECAHFGGEVPLANVRLEKKLGRTRPDLLAEMSGEPREAFHGPIAIEVTVTHGIDEARYNRICAEGVASLEVDLSGLSRTTTRSELKLLLRSGKVPSYWVFHPAVAAREAALRRTVDITMDQELAEWYAHDFLLEHRDRSDGPLTWGRYDEKRYLAQERLIALGSELARRGFLGPDRNNWELERVLGRLYSIRDDRPTMYKAKTLWEVVNAILQDRRQPLSRGFHFHYLVALRAYGRRFLAHQQFKVDQWREEVRQGFESFGSIYYPNRAYDELISLLFPEMAAGLAWSSGKSHPHRALR